MQLARTERTAQPDHRVRLGPLVPLVPQVQLALRERMELMARSGRRERWDPRVRRERMELSARRELKELSGRRV